MTRYASLVTQLTAHWHQVYAHPMDAWGGVAGAAGAATCLVDLNPRGWTGDEKVGDFSRFAGGPHVWRAFPHLARPS